jgi:branched-chain amino acid transport system substrate-binding protein
VVVLAVLGIGFATFRWIHRPAPIEIAFANSMTGPRQTAGVESLVATRLYIEEINRSGGIDGHPIELVIFDDKSDPVIAEANASAIADSDCLGVLGHFNSNISLAASPRYMSAGLAAISGTSLADELTVDNPSYFRAQVTISAEAQSIAEYIRQVWQAPVVNIIFSNDASGHSFRDGFARGFGNAPFNLWGFDIGAANVDASLDDAVEQLAKLPNPGIVVIGAGADTMPNVVKAVRRHGISARIISAANTGNEELVEAFAIEPEERRHPGFFTENLYVAAPLIFDSTGPEASEFGEAYAKASGKRPSWIGAGAYDAAHMMVEALRLAHVANTPASKATDRDRVRGRLAGFDDPKTAMKGLTGPLYFNETRSLNRSIRVGSLSRGRFITAPEQLVLVDETAPVDVDDEVRADHIVIVGGRPYWRQRVVYTGIDINNVSRIDIRQGAFNVDFYLWMRYSGEDEAPTNVVFPALIDKDAFNPSRAEEKRLLGGINYRLFRIRSDVRANFNLRDYPFDTQELVLRLVNQRERRELVTYVIDRFGLNLATDGPAQTQDTTPYRNLQLWRFSDLRYFVDTASSRSTLGEPSNFDSSARPEYAAFNAVIVMQRRYQVFIIKTLTPMLLLILVVFATLFFPPSLLKEQVTLPVTGILTCAVLLVSLSNQLPDIGYTVAIESVFYVFFALCLMAILSAFVRERLQYAKRHSLAIMLNRSAKTVYVLTVVVTVAAFWWLYIRR